LTLLPYDSNDDDDGMVHCTLESNSLIERYDEDTGDAISIPDYVALSYCWGDPLVTKPICVNNVHVEITTNLEAALRVLRDMNIQVLWIDALCINQNDLSERGLQVMRMGLIYSNASKVLAWIGEESDGSEIAIEYLIVESQKDSTQDPFIQGSKIPVPHFAQPISALLARAYWKRVWVIQEISKGREVDLLCGHRSIDWDYFHGVIRRPGFTNQKEVSALAYFRHGEKKKARPTLIRALSQSKGFLATDSRDKIYGILGLTSDGSDLVPAPNYLQPTANVYFQLLKSLVSERRALNYLFRHHDLSFDVLFPAVTEPEWSDLGSGISTWILSIAGKSWSEAESFRMVGAPAPPRLYFSWNMFSSLPANDPGFTVIPIGGVENYTIQEQEKLPLLFKNGLRTGIYIIDLIDSTASRFHVGNSVELLSRVPNVSGPSTSLESATWLDRQVPQPIKASHVLRSLGRALLIPFFLTRNIRWAAMKNLEDTTFADTIVEMMEGARTSGTSSRQSLPPQNFFQEWFNENRNLHILGRTLEQWVTLHKATSTSRQSTYDFNRLRYDMLNLKILRRAHSMKLMATTPRETLGDAINVAALADMKIAVGKRRQIPGLVPITAQRGDFIALMPHSKLPVILRPINDRTARFIGETAIYIYSSPIASKHVSPFGSGWEPPADWSKRNDIWFPTDYKDNAPWKKMRII